MHSITLPIHMLVAVFLESLQEKAAVGTAFALMLVCVLTFVCVSVYLCAVRRGAVWSQVAVRDARLAAAAPYAASRQQLLDARAAHLAEWGAHTAHRADELSAAEQQLQARLTAAATREQQLVARVAELDAREWQLQQQRVPTSP